MIIALIALLFASCADRKAASVDGERMAFEYSQLLKVTEGDGYTCVEIQNPWDSTHVLHRYVLVAKDAAMPEELPEGDVIRTPLEKTVVYSAVHTNLMQELGKGDAVVGVCDAQYMKSDFVTAGLKDGRIADLGESAAPIIEKVIDINPEAILLSPYQDSGNYGRLGNTGITLVECADYMETSALGRAEWVKFYGMLFGEEIKADSIFKSVVAEYDSLKAMAAGVKTKPRVFADMKYGSTWYVAGVNSTAAQLYIDAGGDYVFADELSTGGVPYDPEVVFDRVQDADIWIIKYNQATDKTYDELARDYSNYAQIRAFKERHIFACNTQRIDFYETTPFHPNLVLRDLIKVFHPGLLGNEPLQYFEPLKE